MPDEYVPMASCLVVTCACPAGDVSDDTYDAIRTALGLARTRGTELIPRGKGLDVKVQLPFKDFGRVTGYSIGAPVYRECLRTRTHTLTLTHRGLPYIPHTKVWM